MSAASAESRSISESTAFTKKSSQRYYNISNTLQDKKSGVITSCRSTKETRRHLSDNVTDEDSYGESEGEAVTESYIMDSYDNLYISSGMQSQNETKTDSAYVYKPKYSSSKVSKTSLKEKNIASNIERTVETENVSYDEATTSEEDQDYERVQTLEKSLMKADREREVILSCLGKEYAERMALQDFMEDMCAKFGYDFNHLISDEGKESELEALLHSMSEMKREKSERITIEAKLKAGYRGEAAEMDSSDEEDLSKFKSVLKTIITSEKSKYSPGRRQKYLSTLCDSPLEMQGANGTYERSESLERRHVSSSESHQSRRMEVNEERLLTISGAEERTESNSEYEEITKQEEYDTDDYELPYDVDGSDSDSSVETSYERHGTEEALTGGVTIVEHVKRQTSRGQTQEIQANDVEYRRSKEIPEVTSVDEGIIVLTEFLAELIHEKQKASQIIAALEHQTSISGSRGGSPGTSGGEDCGSGRRSRSNSLGTSKGAGEESWTKQRLKTGSKQSHRSTNSLSYSDRGDHKTESNSQKRSSGVYETGSSDPNSFRFVYTIDSGISERDYKRLLDIINLLKRSKHSWCEEVKDLQAQLQEANRDKESLIQDNDVLRTSLQAANEAIRQIKTKVEELKQIILPLKQDNSRLATENISLKEAIEKGKVDKHETSQDIVELRKYKEEHSRNIKRLRAEISSYEEKITGYKEEITCYRDEIACYKERVTVLEENEEMLRTNNKLLNEKYQEVKLQVDTHNKAKKDSKELSEKENEKLHSDISRLILEVKNKNEQLTEQGQIIEEMNQRKKLMLPKAVQTSKAITDSQETMTECGLVESDEEMGWRRNRHRSPDRKLAHEENEAVLDSRHSSETDKAPLENIAEGSELDDDVMLPRETTVERNHQSRSKENVYQELVRTEKQSHSRSSSSYNEQKSMEKELEDEKARRRYEEAHDAMSTKVSKSRTGWLPSNDEDVMEVRRKTLAEAEITKKQNSLLKKDLVQLKELLKDYRTENNIEPVSTHEDQMEMSRMSRKEVQGEVQMRGTASRTSPSEGSIPDSQRPIRITKTVVDESISAPRRMTEDQSYKEMMNAKIVQRIKDGGLDKAAMSTREQASRRRSPHDDNGGFTDATTRELPEHYMTSSNEAADGKSMQNELLRQNEALKSELESMRAAVGKTGSTMTSHHTIKETLRDKKEIHSKEVHFVETQNPRMELELLQQNEALRSELSSLKDILIQQRDLKAHARQAADVTSFSKTETEVNAGNTASSSNNTAEIVQVVGSLSQRRNRTQNKQHQEQNVVTETVEEKASSTARSMRGRQEARQNNNLETSYLQYIEACRDREKRKQESINSKTSSSMTTRTTYSSASSSMRSRSAEQKQSHAMNGRGEHTDYIRQVAGDEERAQTLPGLKTQMIQMNAGGGHGARGPRQIQTTTTETTYILLNDRDKKDIKDNLPNKGQLPANAIQKNEEMLSDGNNVIYLDELEEPRRATLPRSRRTQSFREQAGKRSEYWGPGQGWSSDDCRDETYYNKQRMSEERYHSSKMSSSHEQKSTMESRKLEKGNLSLSDSSLASDKVEERRQQEQFNQMQSTEFQMTCEFHRSQAQSSNTNSHKEASLVKHHKEPGVSGKYYCEMCRDMVRRQREPAKYCPEKYFPIGETVIKTR